VASAAGIIGPPGLADKKVTAADSVVHMMGPPGLKDRGPSFRNPGASTGEEATRESTESRMMNLENSMVAGRWA
jgi:hypothetical protein